MSNKQKTAPAKGYTRAPANAATAAKKPSRAQPAVADPLGAAAATVKSFFIGAPSNDQAKAKGTNVKLPNNKKQTSTASGAPATSTNGGPGSGYVRPAVKPGDYRGQQTRVLPNGVIYRAKERFSERGDVSIRVRREVWKKP